MKLLADEKFISHLHFTGSIGIVVAVVAALGFYFIRQQQTEYKDSARALTEQQIAQHKAELIEEVTSTKEYLDFMRSRTDLVLMSKVREEVNQVMSLAWTIYQRERGHRNEDEIKALIIETIRPLRFGEGPAYFFIHGTDGICVLLPTDPQLEGKDVSRIRDDLGRRIHPRLIDAARGAGFLRFRWKNPDKSNFAEKIGYVRLFEPYGWVIGAGEYLEVIERDLQHDALERLRAATVLGGGHIGVLDDNGRYLVAPANPEWEGVPIDRLPPDRAEILRGLVSLGRQGGGFISYLWNRPGEVETERRLSYVTRMEDWGWTLISGVYLDDVDKATDAGRDALAQSVKLKVHLTLLVLALGLIGSILLSWGVSVLLKSVVDRYKSSIEERNRELKEANRRLFLVNFMVDNSAEMIFLTDEDDRLVYANQFLLRRLGWDKDQVISGPLREIVHSVDAPGVAEGEYVRSETTIQAIDGQFLPLEVGVKEVIYEGGAYRFAIARDIAERRRWEGDLKRSNAELEAFAYVASHDLRQPLRAVSSFLSLLERRLEGRLEPEAKEFLDFARDGARRMDRLILDLLSYSRVGRLSRPMAPIDFARVIDSLAPMLALAMSEAKGTLMIEETLPTVWGDAQELGRLVENLVDNAVKYRSKERPLLVTLSCRSEGENWLFAVTDNGIGIDPDNRERIFGLFQRLHTAEEYEGTGIGLAICRKIVDRHGGRIWVDSEPGRGSTFFFTLPVMARASLAEESELLTQDA